MEINFHNFGNKILYVMAINRIVMEYFNNVHVIKEHESHFFNTKLALKIAVLGLATEN